MFYSRSLQLDEMKAVYWYVRMGQHTLTCVLSQTYELYRITVEKSGLLPWYIFSILR